MSKQNTNILITGFGPFPGALENPSPPLVEVMAKTRPPLRVAGAKISYGTLPTSWQKVGPSLDRLFDRHNPDLTVLLGYASTSPGFQLETTALNQTCAHEDVDGVAGPCRPVSKDGSAQLHSSAPLQRIETTLKEARLDTTRSDDAGRYLCNMAYYLALNRAMIRQSLFIHIPAIKTANCLIPKDHQGDNYLTLAEAQRGVEVIIATLINEDFNALAARASCADSTKG